MMPFLRGSLSTLLGRACHGVALLVSGGVMARLLSTEEFAAYLLALTATTALGVAAALGLPALATRHVAAFEALHRPDATRAFVARSYGAIWFGVGAVVTAIALAAQPIAGFLNVGSDGSGWLALLLGGWVTCNALRLLAAGILRGLRRLLLATLFDGAVLSAGLLVGVLCLWATTAQAHLRTVLAIAAGASVISTLGALAVVIRLIGSKPRPQEEDGSAALLSASLPLAGTALLGQALNHASLWLLGLVAPPAEVAVYGAGLQVFVATSFAFTIVNSAGRPFVAGLHAQRDRAGLCQLVRRLALLAALPASLVLATIATAGPDLMGSLYGAVYSGGAHVALLLGCGLLVQILAGPNAMLLSMTGHQRAVLTVMLGTTSLFACGTLLGYDQLGHLGVAGLGGSVFALDGLILAIVVRRRLGFWPSALLALVDDGGRIVRRWATRHRSAALRVRSAVAADAGADRDRHRS